MVAGRKHHLHVQLKAKASLAAELTWPQVHAFRLQRHHLATRAPNKDLVRVAGDIGGAQAQVMSAAEVQLAARVDCSVSEVRDALWKSRSLVKTWLMRGTLHLIPSQDLPLFAAAMNGPWSKPRPSVLKWFGASEAELRQLVTTIGGALNGQPMTREEIITVAGKGQSERVRQSLRSGWGGFLKPVARAGLLCFGPSRGQSVTFVKPQEWLGSWRVIEPEAALIDVARRYLHTYGPATKRDFESWFGRWPSIGNRAWAGLESEQVSVAVANVRMQMLGSDLMHMPALRSTVNLLPAFDPYLMGHATRDHLFDAVHRAKVARTAGWISQCVLVDGEVQGVWKHEVSGKTMRVTVEPFNKLTPKIKSEIGGCADSLAQAMGLSKAHVTFSSLS